MWAVFIAIVLGGAAIATAKLQLPLVAIPAAALSALLLIIWAFHNENWA